MPVPAFTTHEYAPGRLLDVFRPPTPSAPGPALVAIHGGGLVQGTRSQLQEPVRRWLIGASLRSPHHHKLKTIRPDRAHADGITIMAIDYSLLPIHTANDILSDIKTLFSHLTTHSASTYNIDPLKIGLIGSSAGCYVAQLAALHCSPRALGLYWGMNSFLANDYWIRPRSVLKGFFERLPPEHTIRLFFKEGTWLDVLTGEKGLGEKLRSCGTPEERRWTIPERCRAWFPELAWRSVERWPATAIVHGTADTAVWHEESEELARALRERGDVEVQFELVEGGEHGLEGGEGAQQARERVYEFVAKQLLSS